MTPRVITTVFPVVPVASRATKYPSTVSKLGICTKVMERDQSITDVHEKKLDHRRHRAVNKILEGAQRAPYISEQSHLFSF